MMKMTAETTSRDQTRKLAEIVKKISQLQVFVGIPEEKAPRSGSGEVSNAQLMYIHTHGSPVRGIPARPVIEPAIEAEDNREAISEEFAFAAKSAMAGKEDAARKHLALAGMRGQNAARDWFEDPRNGWPPNSPITVAMKGSDMPLIDTGQLRKSITYVVKDGE